MTEPAGFPKVEKTFGFTVLLGGLITSAVTLAAVFALNRAGFSAMGFYLSFVIPIGAILVGMAAGSGYALTTWLSGIRVTAVLCVVIVLLQLGSYAAAEYIDYRQTAPTYEDGTPVDFATWFDFTTRSFAFQGKDGEPGEPLGALGYGVRLLEVLGFAFGGLLGALILMSKPYCPQCQVYMSAKNLSVLPAGVKRRKFSRKEVEAASANQAEQDEALAKATQSLEGMIQMARDGKVDEFRSVIAELSAGRKQAAKTWRRIQIAIVRCKRCHAGKLRATLFERLAGNKSRSQKLGEWDVGQDFVQRYVQGW